LNIGKLLEAASSGVFTAISVSATPWAVPFASLLLWRSLWSSAEIPISETEVVVLIALHRLKNSKKIVEKSEIEILDSVNEALRKHERPTISQSDLRYAMIMLEKIDSIEKVKTSGGWFIREWVSVSYR